MRALFGLFLCFGSYPEKLEEYISTFYRIRYILEEIYVAVMRIISRLIIYIDQLNAAHFSISAWLFLPWNNVGIFNCLSLAISCPSILAFMINNLITSRNIRVYATTYIHKFLDLTARNHDSKCTTFLGHVIISIQPPEI